MDTAGHGVRTFLNSFLIFNKNKKTTFWAMILNHEVMNLLFNYWGYDCLPVGCIVNQLMRIMCYCLVNTFVVQKQHSNSLGNSSNFSNFLPSFLSSSYNITHYVVFVLVKLFWWLLDSSKRFERCFWVGLWAVRLQQHCGNVSAILLQCCNVIVALLQCYWSLVIIL